MLVPRKKVVDDFERAKKMERLEPLVVPIMPRLLTMGA